METPYFMNNWNNFPPRNLYSPIVREVPVNRTAAPNPNPKVVSIPIRFVKSEQSETAVKIQKVFRGFLVRKSVKKVAAIRREVDEIEKKISERDEVEFLRSNAKERLKVNEMLMSLLLKLDSVRGVDSGVRDCRKSVIKKAIALQERVDAIASGDLAMNEVDQSSNVDDTNNTSAKVVDHDQAMESTDLGENSIPHDSAISSTDCSNSSEIHMDSTLEKECKSPEAEDSGNSGQKNDEEPVPNSKITIENRGEEKEDGMEIVQSDEGPVRVPNSMITTEAEQSLENHEEEKEDGMEIVQSEKNSSIEAKDEKRRHELLERMIEENGRMMSLMAELFERNQVQTRLLRSLSHRVEELERAFLCEKLRKKKKKLAAAAGSVDDAKKSGHR
ncbi:hypothetical protein UlMin_040066 [Ulmus minor]